MLIQLKVPARFVHDLEFISQNLNIDKKEWLKVKIAELISKERYRIIQSVEDRYIKGYISDKEYKEETGIKPSNNLKSNKRDHERQKDINRKGAENYFLNLREIIKKEKIYKKNNPTIKKYMKEVIKKINNQK